MDLKQTKLSKSEWESIEVPVSQEELGVLKMIVKGYANVNIKINENCSLLTFLKIQKNDNMIQYLYVTYLQPKIEKNMDVLIKLINYKKTNLNKTKINSTDKIRINNLNASISTHEIYDFILIDELNLLLENYNKPKKEVDFHKSFYTLSILIQNSVCNINSHLMNLINSILNSLNEFINMNIIIENAPFIIEKNLKLLKYADLSLYEHQKEIFTISKNKNPKLIMYIAPTGTGKTMTPLALSEKNKIIFVCAARHVGLALAKSALSIGKKVAFAFGCEDAGDIKLHYSAAKEYTINKKSGGIGKVDNSAGQNVEIIISDIQSYIHSMYYMLSFFDKDDIILYWDEPTITLDYDEHVFHETINQIWKNNTIPNIILSSATLPKEYEIPETISDYKNKFDGEVYCVTSYDCKKSIPIINNDGFVVLPHNLKKNYYEMLEIVKNCYNNLTLLRYFDLDEIVNFIKYVLKNNCTNKVPIEAFFDSVSKISMTKIKLYYLNLLKEILPEKWDEVFVAMTYLKQPKILENNSVDNKGNKIRKYSSLGPGTNLGQETNSGFSGKELMRLKSDVLINDKKIIGTSGVYISTKDAYTLTDGPTIFMANDVDKIAKFCLQQCNIPQTTMSELIKKISHNNQLNEKIKNITMQLEELKENMEKEILSASGSNKNKSSKDLRKFNKDMTDNESSNKKNSSFEINSLHDQMQNIRNMMLKASLNDIYIPNKKSHLEKWCPTQEFPKAFTSNIDEATIAEIMQLEVDDLWKLLIMIGVGVFTTHNDEKYTEIMKKLAIEQKLYLIIASTDYIYGTNYQFCHAFLSKDLNLTQEKIIQAMGRIGRNNIQQTYTVRFRDNSHIEKLFLTETNKPEVINMNKLLSSN